MTSPGARAELLARRDVELIIECSKVFPDVLPSIRRWQSLGMKVALVSNCVANTRPLLEALGLLAAVDATLLSCEVGSAKPARDIYLLAAVALGVDPQGALFVDDHARFCVGAEAVGMQAVVIDRERVSAPQSEIGASITSLAELDHTWVPH